MLVYVCFWSYNYLHINAAYSDSPGHPENCSKETGPIWSGGRGNEKQQVVSNSKCTVEVVTLKKAAVSQKQSEAPLCCFLTAGKVKQFKPEASITNVSRQMINCGQASYLTLQFLSATFLKFTFVLSVSLKLRELMNFTFVVVDYRNKAFSLTQVCSEFHVLNCSV